MVCGASSKKSIGQILVPRSLHHAFASDSWPVITGSRALIIGLVGREKGTALLSNNGRSSRGDQSVRCEQNSQVASRLNSLGGEPLPL
jgi:hypothetical protein